MLDFLRARATPGVENVEPGRYTRNIQVDGNPGSVSVTQVPGEHPLCCAIDLPGSRALFQVTARLRHLFDLDADSGSCPMVCCTFRSHNRWRN